MQVAGNGFSHPFSQVGRTNSFALSPVSLVPNHRNRQVHLIGMSRETGGNRIETGRHRSKKADERFGIHSGLGKLQKQINQFPAPHEFHQSFLVGNLKKFSKLIGLGDLIEFLDLHLTQNGAGEITG